MEYFSSILFLLLSWWFSPLEPTSFAPLPHGIFLGYGFGTDYYGPELAPTIVNFMKTGVYKIEEEDISFKGQEDTGKSYYDLSSNRILFLLMNTTVLITQKIFFGRKEHL